MFKLRSFLVVFLLHGLTFVSADDDGTNSAQKAVLDILSSSNYSKFARPGTPSTPTQIKVNMLVRRVEKIDDILVSII